MAVNLSPVGGVAAQFFDNNGNPLSGGKLFTYIAGTTTPAATFTSSLGTTAQPNPIVLDSAGRVSGSGEIWLTDGVIYKFVLQTSTNVLIATYDNITGINSNFVNFTAEQEIQTATAGQTVFNLADIQYQPGTNSLTVYVDGVNQYGPGAQYAYLETDSDTVTFVSGLHVGASVKFTTATQTTGNATDASVVTYTPPFANSVETTVEDKLAQTVSVEDFGAVGNGVADDTAEIQAAFSALGSAGGSVLIPNNMRCLVDNNLTIPVNCSLVGPHEFVGSPGDNTSAPYGSMGGALIVNSAATITVSSNASINGLLIYRKGMTFPTVNASAFAGTAITIDGDDAAVSHCQILGFNKAVYSTGDQRQRINNLWFDCVNGIEIENCLDIPYINTCHGWPFATIEASAAGTPGASIIRTGIGFYLHDTVDWAKLTDCFTYGYFRGFQLTDVNSCTLLSCSADNTTSAGVPTHAGSIGFSIGGQENRLIGCQAAAQDSAGATFATNTGVMHTVIGFNAWACGTQGILLSGGDLSVSSSNFRSMANGITISNTNARFIDGGGNRFESIVGKPYNFSAASDTSKVQLADILSDLVNGNPITSGTYTIPSIASASVVSLPVNGDFFTVTGTTSIGTLEGGHAGRVVTLTFSGILSVLTSTGVTTAMRLSGNANYTSSANSTLTLLHTGTQWLEIGRSA